jgi:L-amino acid N-acyltransferase YncA
LAVTTSSALVPIPPLNENLISLSLKVLSLFEKYPRQSKSIGQLCHVDKRKLFLIVIIMSVAFKLPPVIRSARPEDIPQVHAIYSHYVLHTPTDMHHVPPSLASFAADYGSLTSLDLPYLVAVASPYVDISQSPNEASETSLKQESQDTGHVLGFIHAFPFRGYKLGYSHTAELAIICHPDVIKHGVGSALMKAFLDALEKGRKIEQILAFMTVLEDEREDSRVKGFYEKWGFREAGKMTDVGQKFGRR